MNIGTFADDLDKKRNGVRINLGGGAYIIVAAAGTPAFFESFRRHREQIIGDDTATAELLSRVAAEAYADTVLLGWGGLEDLDGSELVYSRARAVELMTDPKFERFFNLVDAESKNIANFRLKVVNDEKKSSPSTS